jgi:hypothetical protein
MNNGTADNERQRIIDLVARLQARHDMEAGGGDRESGNHARGAGAVPDGGAPGGLADLLPTIAQVSQQLRTMADGLSAVLTAPAFVYLIQAARVVTLIRRAETAFREAADATDELARLAGTMVSS